MSQPTAQKVSVVDAMTRKQEWDIAELQYGLARARELVEQLSDAAHRLETRISEAESGLRCAAEAASVLSVDTIARARRFLAEQYNELTNVLHERQRAEAVMQEFVKKIAELRLKVRLYDNLASRMRIALAVEEEKAEMQQLDALWLARVGGMS